ncbi:MAG: calcium-binding protein [Deltaproteobacteria bacterium]|nr:calcium-binding protein [Deltaproteobacteria bacterium]MCB9788396.1 calcium-binding protein [Deltaproteobacteria bacterium]
MNTRNSLTHIFAAASLYGASLMGFGACADAPAPAPAEAPDDGIGLSAAELGSVLASCSTAGSSGYDSDTKTLTLALGGGVTEVVIAVPNKQLAVNHNPCVDSNGVALTTTSVKKIVVNGTTGDDEVIIDAAPGSFGGIFSVQGGITVDMGGGTGDAFKVRGSSGVDKWTVGVSGSDTFFELSGDKNADVMVSNAESFVIALGDGADTFTGAGGAISAAHLADGVTSLSAVTDDLVINGGAGNDTLTGGDGDDTISGGDGDDTFKAAAVADGADTLAGGAGTDTADYSARTGDLTVTLDGVANDGLASETDNVGTDVENITGGAGDDTLTGSNIGNKILGGDGDDTLSGGTGNGDCTLDVDVLEGGAGDDIFNQGSAADCGDSMVGGAGTDTANYGSRTNDLTIDIDNSSDDGEAAEGDNVKTDVEKVVGGAGDDVITGSSGADILDGGAGDDTLSGAAGDDTFLEGAADSGSDVMNGGLGTDTVDYSARVADLTVTLCMDSAAATGDSTVGDCATHNDGLAGELDQLINIEGVQAGTGDDDITGSTGNDTLEGGAGDDTIAGGGGADSIFGDDDDDTLTGGDGDDYIDGGAGTDTGDGEAGDGDICTQVTPTNCEL